jgi:hypothetical protein
MGEMSHSFGMPSMPTVSQALVLETEAAIMFSRLSRWLVNRGKTGVNPITAGKNACTGGTGAWGRESSLVGMLWQKCQLKLPQTTTYNRELSFCNSVMPTRTSVPFIVLLLVLALFSDREEQYPNTLNICLEEEEKEFLSVSPHRSEVTFASIPASNFSHLMGHTWIMCLSWTNHCQE